MGTCLTHSRRLESIEVTLPTLLRAGGFEKGLFSHLQGDQLQSHLGKRPELKRKRSASGTFRVYGGDAYAPRQRGFQQGQWERGSSGQTTGYLSDGVLCISIGEEFKVDGCMYHLRGAAWTLSWTYIQLNGQTRKSRAALSTWSVRTPP